MTLHRTVVALLIIAVVLLLAACDVLEFDTTRTEPPVDTNAQAIEDTLRMVTEARETREAR